MKTKKRASIAVFVIAFGLTLFSHYSYASIEVQMNTDLEFHEQVLGEEKSRVTKEIAVTRKSKIRLYDTMKPREPHNIQILRSTRVEKKNNTVVEYNHNVALDLEESPEYISPIFIEKKYFKQTHREVVKSFVAGVEKSKLKEIVKKIDILLPSVDDGQIADSLYGIRYVSMEVLMNN